MRKPFGKILNPSLAKRVRRKLSIRKKVVGTAECPRVCINKTNRHLTVQVIDDSIGKTLFSEQTFGKNGVSGGSANKEGAKKLGVKLATKLKDSNISRVVFDRNGYEYSGVVAEFADSVRGGNINF